MFKRLAVYVFVDKTLELPESINADNSSICYFCGSARLSQAIRDFMNNRKIEFKTLTLIF